MKFFEMPNPFADLSREARLEILRTIGAEAKQKFANLFPRVREWFQRYDAPYLLAFCAVYFLSSPEGTDREATEGKLDFYHHYLELLQAFALTQERAYSVEPLSGRAGELQKFMQDLGEAIGLSGFSNVPENVTDEEMNKRRVLAQMRAQTTSIRNWAYPDQASRTVTAVFEAIGPALTESVGVEPRRLIAALKKVGEGSEEKLNEHLKKIRNVMQAKTHRDAWARYCQAFPDLRRERGDADKIFQMAGRDVERFKWAIVYHSDLRLADIFTFRLDEFAEWYGPTANLERLQAVLDAWSFTFGDLKDHNAEHFVLDNPVLRRPLIRLDSRTYFCPIIGILYHMLAGMMEGLLRRSGDANLLKRYERSRARFLEDETERLLRAAVPTGQVFRGSKWRDPETRVEYENDLLVTLPPYAVVIECKSGLVDPPARRGAELRLVDTLEDLVITPAEQANRFIGFLSSHAGVHEFRTDDGRVNRVGNRDVRYYVPVSITYENLGTISANLKDLSEARLIAKLPNPLVPSICVTDLEIITQLLVSEIELIHYLARRAQIEQELSYFGDEMDLFAFYLDTGFNVLGESQDGKPLGLNLLLKSKELDPYFTARLAGVDVQKPMLDLTRWWRDILKALATRKPSRWVEIGYALLNAGKSDQDKFERALRELTANVRDGRVEHEHNWIVLKAGSGNRSFAVVGFPYGAIDRAERNKILGHIAAEASAHHELLGIVLLGVKAEMPAYPYDVLAYVPSEEITRLREPPTSTWKRITNWLRSKFRRKS